MENKEIELEKTKIIEEINNQGKFMVLDTSYFIRLKPLNLEGEIKYMTTEFIIREIRDEKAREFYELNKNFITVKNPSRESMKVITNFAKLSNDLKSLSIPDVSVLSLAYELVKNSGQESLLRKEPMKFEVIETVKQKEHKINIENNQTEMSTTQNNEEDDGFVEVKSKSKKIKKVKKVTKEFDDNDEGEWITPENIDSKLNKFKIADEEELKESKLEPNLNVSISSADFTLQNVALKMGIPIESIDGMKIRKIKNYILKCYSCNNFIFDTSKMFCDDCGYNTLMKIACSINAQGKMKIYDKKAEARLRGTQV